MEQVGHQKCVLGELFLSLFGLPDCHEVGGFPPSQCFAQLLLRSQNQAGIHFMGVVLTAGIEPSCSNSGSAWRASQDLLTVLGAPLSPLVAARALRAVRRADNHHEEKAGYRVPEAAKTEHRRSGSGQHGYKTAQLQMPEPRVRHQQGPWQGTL